MADNSASDVKGPGLMCCVPTGDNRLSNPISDYNENRENVFVRNCTVATTREKYSIQLPTAIPFYDFKTNCCHRQNGQHSQVCIIHSSILIDLLIECPRSLGHAGLVSHSERCY